MHISSKIFKQTGYFLQEIARSKIVLQAVLVGLIAGALVVLFKVSIDSIFSHIQAFCSGLYVKDVMARNVVTLNTDSTIKQAENALSEYGHGAYPIINSKNKLAGIITKSDIEDALFQGLPESTTIDKIMNPAPVTITPQNNLYIAYYRLHSNDTEWLVVIDRNNKIKGIITRLDINNAFHKEFS